MNLSKKTIVTPLVLWATLLSLQDQSNKVIVDAYEVAAYCGPSWLTDCSLVPTSWARFAGGFDHNIQTPPPALPSQFDVQQNRLVIGGANVMGAVPSAQSIVTMMDKSRCSGVNFDMEGEIAGNYALVQSLANGIKSISLNTTTYVTCLGTWSSEAAEVESSFDGIGIMAYGGSMTGQGWGIPEDDPESGDTWHWIQQWINSGVPNNKIILGATTAGLKPYMIDWYKTLITTYGFKGIFIWKLADLPSTGITAECIEDPEVSCVDTAVSGSQESPPVDRHQWLRRMS